MAKLKNVDQFVTDLDEVLPGMGWVRTGKIGSTEDESENEVICKLSFKLVDEALASKKQKKLTEM